MKSFNDLLQSPLMRALMRKTVELDKLNQLLNAALPLELQGHYQAKSYTNSCLWLQTDSAAWATRIRYLIPNLVKKLARSLPELTNIQCSVAPPIYNAPKTAPKRLFLSHAVRSLFNTTAAGIKDKKLREALEKLGRNRD